MKENRSDKDIDNLSDKESGKDAAKQAQGTGLFDREALMATQVRYLTPENSEFSDGGGCLILCDKKTGEKKRVVLHLLFPFNTERKLVSALDADKQEVGMIRDIDDFEGESLEAIEKEIDRRHFIRTITKILEIKDKNGITAWKVEIEGGSRAEFALKDTYGSIFHVTETRLLITDMDGNRFEIKDAAALDGASRRKIELYL